MRVLKANSDESLAVGPREEEISSGGSLGGESQLRWVLGRRKLIEVDPREEEVK